MAIRKLLCYRQDKLMSNAIRPIWHYSSLDASKFVAEGHIGSLKLTTDFPDRCVGDHYHNHPINRGL